MTDDSIYDDNYYLGLPVDSGRIRTLTERIAFRKSDVVCEIGCAAGHFLAEISPHIASGVGLDTSAAAIAAARSISDRGQLDNLRYEQISAQEFAAADANRARFDYVLLLDVTEHVDDNGTLEIFTAAKRLLKPGGQLIIHTPNLTYWLEMLKDRGVIKQLRGHIAVRDEAHYLGLLDTAGLHVLKVVGLPHYRQPMRAVDSLLMHLPILGRLFRSRLFIVVADTIARQGNES